MRNVLFVLLLSTMHYIDMFLDMLSVIVHFYKVKHIFWYLLPLEGSSLFKTEIKRVQKWVWKLSALWVNEVKFWDVSFILIINIDMCWHNRIYSLFALLFILCIFYQCTSGCVMCIIFWNYLFSKLTVRCVDVSSGHVWLVNSLSRYPICHHSLKNKNISVFFF